MHLFSHIPILFATRHLSLESLLCKLYCLHVQCSGACVMEDDLIDDSGFELGMPTRVEMLQRYCSILEAELDTTRQDLRRAHETIAGMIVMYRTDQRSLPL